MLHRNQAELRTGLLLFLIAVLIATLAWQAESAPAGPPATTSPFTAHLAGQPAAHAVIGAGQAAVQEGKPQLPPGAEVRVVVDTETRTITARAGSEVLGAYPVAIGKWSTPTPIGEWKVVDKDHDWGGAFGARWIGLNISWGRYGIHGTNQPWTVGAEASLGCMRMHDEDVVKLFDLVKVGTEVDIVGPPHKTNLWHRTLGPGMNGPDVVYVQLALKKEGFYPYRCDGIFGRLTGLGVRCFQTLEGLPVTGKVDKETDQQLLREERVQSSPENSSHD